MRKTIIVSTLAIAMSLVAPTIATAQFISGPQPGGGSGGGGGQNSKPAWEQFNLPDKSVKLNFRNANVDLVLDLYMKVSGITIVKDPSLKEPMTVSSPKPVKIKEAFEILNAALNLRNFQLEKQGSLLVIKPRRQENNNSNPFAGIDPSIFNQPKVELKVYRITHASASEVARVINEVFAAQQQANNPFMFGGGGFGGGNQGRGRGGFNFGGMNFGQQQGSNIRASSDDFSNSVIVNAPRDKQREVEALIEEIDKLTDAPLQTKVFPLEYAAASDLVTTVQTVLTANAPTGRGTSGQGNQGGFNSFIRRISGPGQGEANVAADVRSNSLIISATDSAMKVVESLILELDKEVEVENTTFVIPLDNARADNVAELLNSAFGTRNTGNRNSGGTANNRTGGNNRNTGGGNNRNTGGGGGGGVGGRGIDESPTRIVPDGKGGGEVVMDFEDGEEGVLYTQVRTQQGQFGFNNQGRNQQGGTSNVARGADGRLVNVRDLGGQVTIIPDPNTNSLIIVTAPENMELIRSILGQIDRIPEQVMIETLIVEATLDKSLKLGVEWNYGQGSNGNAATSMGLQNANPALQGLRYTYTSGNLTAFLNALATDDKFQVLSTPRIFTSNNVEAEINISQSIPYILSTREDANGNLTYNYSFEDVGIVLNVVPRITQNGMVTMDVTQTANDLQGFTDFNAPIVNQRQAFTTVSVIDGETIVLGGMMRSTVTSKVKKLPLLGDIPLLGELFKTRDKQEVKTELLVFLTPRVVRNSEEGARLTEDEKNRLSGGSQKDMQKALPPTTKNSSGIKSGPKKEIGQ